MEIPDFITHYNRGEPFRSMSSIPREMLPDIIQKLSETNAWGLARFSDPDYLNRRLLVEQKLRSEFITKGGKPSLHHPSYFFLGRNAQFESNSKNIGYKILLKDLPKDVVSFTYGDSMFSLNEDYRQLKGEAYLSDLCPHVYVLDELPRIFSQNEKHLHIEAQLWITPSDAVFSRCD